MKPANLVLVPGWGLGHAAWASLLPELCAHFCVQLVEFTGYTAQENIAEQAARLRLNEASFAQSAQMLADALPENSVLLGWSLGSLVALKVASLAPARLRGLILIGSTPCFVQRTDWLAAQTPALLDSFCTELAKNPATTIRRFIALFNQGDEQARALGRSLTRALASAPLPDTDALLNGLSWLRDVDLRDEIAHVSTPTLLMHGANDPLMPLAAAVWLQKNLACARLDILPATAHAPFLADPQGFVHRLTDFANALPSP